MQPLRTFFMEDWLETNRFSAKFNLGESGGKVRNVAELLIQSNLNKENIIKQFCDMPLNDSPNWGRPDLREVIAKLHPGAHANNVLITTGTSEALYLLFNLLKPKKLALALPGFQLLYEIPHAFGADIIPLPIYWNQIGIPFIDKNEWLNILESEKPDCVLINNPHNPSGLIIEDSFLQEVKALVSTWKANIIGDEHYRFLASETEDLGYTIFENNENIFVTGSFIKCLGVPGLRIGWCVGNTETLSGMQNQKNYTTHTVSPITEWIAYEVLKNQHTPLFSAMRQEWITNRQILANFLNLSQTIYGYVPEGGLVTSLGFKNVSSMEDTMRKISILSKKGIFVLPLSAMEFGKFKFSKFASSNAHELSNLNYGFGFRCGLGIAPEKLERAFAAFE